jgi:hypothetical protein
MTQHKPITKIPKRKKKKRGNFPSQKKGGSHPRVPVAQVKLKSIKLSKKN